MIEKENQLHEIALKIATRLACAPTRFWCKEGPPVLCVGESLARKY